MNNPRENSGGGSSQGASAAKLRGNRVHSRLKTLCHQWMKKNLPKVTEKLRRQARQGAAR